MRKRRRDGDNLEESVDKASPCILTVEGSAGDASNPIHVVSDEESAGDASNPIKVVSDEEYAGELQIQEAIASALLVLDIPDSPAPAPNRDAACCCPPSSTAAAAAEPSARMCAICMESKETTDTFLTGSCGHWYCRDCVCTYIAVRLKEEGSRIRCPEPGCVSIMDAYRCQGILPGAVFERWSAMLAESMMHAENLFYCPYRDCSGPMESDGTGTGTISMAECPYCRRLLCKRCRVGWHLGLSCKEHKRLRREGKSDTLFLKMAKERLWKRCPGCRVYVEKVFGCLHVRCRCKVEFCYKCGALWNCAHRC